MLRNILFAGASVLAISSSVHAGVNVGAKVGAAFGNGKYKEKSDSGGIFSTPGPAEFSGGDSKIGAVIDVFASKDIYDNNSLFIDGEASLSILGAKIATDTDAKKRSGSNNMFNDVKAKERFSGTIAVNIGAKVSNGMKAYAKLGLNLASVNVKQSFDPDTDDATEAATKSENVFMPGALLGVGLSSKVSEKISVLAEATYTFRGTKSLEDFLNAYSGTNENFKDRKISLDSAAIKLGICYAI